MQRRRPELARAVLLLAEGGGHAPATVGALLEGDARQVAAQIIGPRVIDALEAPRLPPVVERDEGAAMRAAVFEGADGAVLRPHDDDGHLTHEGRAEVARPLDIGLEADVAPHRPLEDADRKSVV